MEGPDGIQLEYPVGSTLRGTLWAGTRRNRSDRIVRIVEPRLCDKGFRQGLANLSQAHYPRMLPIVSHGWFGVHYYIEYEAGSAWQTLDKHFSDLNHWRRRMEVISQLCEVLDRWSGSPLHPLGLNGRNIVVMNDGGRWFPWLLPCPPVKYSSPCDLFGTDSPISTVAPEVIRGVPFSDRAADVYALGCLAAKALGCRESPEATTDEARVEAQARGALIRFEMRSTEVEAFLRELEPLQRLDGLIHRCTHTSPVARPSGSADVRDSFTGAFAETDPVNLALGAIAAAPAPPVGFDGDRAYAGGPNGTPAVNARFKEALKILDWGFAKVGESIRGRLLAADLCERLGDLRGTLGHLDGAVALAPAEGALRQRRCDLRWVLYSSLPPLVTDHDPEGDLLLEDLNFLKPQLIDGVERNKPYMRAAAVYRRRKNWNMASQELYRAAEIEPSDLEALLLYSQSLIALGDREGAAKTIELANRRIGNMVTAQLLGEAEAQEWNDRFKSVSAL